MDTQQYPPATGSKMSYQFEQQLEQEQAGANSHAAGGQSGQTLPRPVLSNHIFEEDQEHYLSSSESVSGYLNEDDNENETSDAYISPTQPVLHTAKHMSSKYFDCTRCGKKLTNKHAFKEHRDKCRLNVEVPADCNMCDKTCFNKKSLFMHKLHKHNQPLAYQSEFIVYGCPVSGHRKRYENCEFTTLFKYLWSVHKKRHATGSKHVAKKTEHVSQSRYTCEICSKNILGKKNFYLHKFHIHSVDLNLQNEFSIFNCPYEGCTFQTLHEYLKKRHLSEHCGVSTVFLDSDVMMDPNKPELKVVVESSSGENINFDESEMEEMLVIYECRICKLQSYDRYEMGAHAYQHSDTECNQHGTTGNTKFYQYYLCKVCPPFSSFRTRFRSTFGRHCQTQQHINRAQMKKDGGFTLPLDSMGKQMLPVGANGQMMKSGMDVMSHLHMISNQGQGHGQMIDAGANADAVDLQHQLQQQQQQQMLMNGQLMAGVPVLDSQSQVMLQGQGHQINAMSLQPGPLQTSYSQTTSEPIYYEDFRHMHMQQMNEYYRQVPMVHFVNDGPPPPQGQPGSTVDDKVIREVPFDEI